MVRPPQSVGIGVDQFERSDLFGQPLAFPQNLGSAFGLQRRQITGGVMAKDRRAVVNLCYRVSVEGADGFDHRASDGIIGESRQPRYRARQRSGYGLTNRSSHRVLTTGQGHRPHVVGDVRSTRERQAIGRRLKDTTTDDIIVIEYQHGVQ